MKLINDDALLYQQSTHTLLSFKDIRLNGFHIETEAENDIEYVTPRLERVYSTCNCRGAYVHQVQL